MLSKLFTTNISANSISFVLYMLCTGIAFSGLEKYDEMSIGNNKFVNALYVTLSALSGLAAFKISAELIAAIAKLASK